MATAGIMSTRIKNVFDGRDWKSFAGRIGPKITFIMGILFLIEGITRISLMFWFYQDTPLILMCGILAIAGVLLGLKGYNYARFLCLIAGILAIVGLMIYTLNFGFRFVLTMFAILLPVAYFLFFLDKILIFLLIFGGILSAISGESFLSFYKARNDLNPSQESKLDIPFCPDCGKKVLPASKFCINCGKRFNGLDKSA
ncbi:hypothetical protein LCGC14_0529860 [marine sediment metagenome]|uniref:Zinc-ribbon domain-containing protein n=1 Tax=marine sediment metagenome TaxID=412755 RepID=A0A0F9UHC2_9ZZZZ